MTLCLIACRTPTPIEVQGHRGCRGLMPENTIEGFIHAVDLGVHTLELDVVFAKDDKIVVSHEAYFNPMITTDPQGNGIDTTNVYQLLFKDMTYDSIRQYDVGMKYHPTFPYQKKIKTHKPLLDSVFSHVEAFRKNKNLPPIHYNIELKVDSINGIALQPSTLKMYSLIDSIVNRYSLIENVNLQCFDVTTLNELYALGCKYPIAYLVEDENSIVNALGLLSFQPDIYSPYYKLLSHLDIVYLKEKGIEIIPWTVNSEQDMRMLIDMNVDGIITDYPDILIRFLQE